MTRGEVCLSAKSGIRRQAVTALEKLDAGGYDKGIGSLELRRYIDPRTARTGIASFIFMAAKNRIMGFVHKSLATNAAPKYIARPRSQCAARRPTRRMSYSTRACWSQSRSPPCVRSRNWTCTSQLDSISGYKGSFGGFRPLNPINPV